jgi:hypothetical protein
MRVLEAVGSGAVLLSDHLPGMELLLEPESEFAILGDDVVADVRRLLADPDRMQAMASRALERSMGINTYDHRVDEIMEIAAEVKKRDVPSQSARGRLATVIDADVEVQRLVHIGAPELADELWNREVWGATEIRPERLRPGNIEAVAIRDGADPDLVVQVVTSARRYVYADGPVEGITEHLAHHHPQAEVTDHGSVRRFDLIAEAYRIMPHEVIAE